MPGRLIDAHDLIESFLNTDADVCAEYYDYGCDWGFSLKSIINLIQNAPTVYAVPVRHGRWETSEDDYFGLYIIKCSLCREEWCFECDDDVFDLNYHYCPNCGAKMDGKDCENNE